MIRKKFFSLAPWKTGENPFKDNYLFEGSGFSPRGNYWFIIRPDAPFSKIMNEVEALNKTGFFKRIPRKEEVVLSDIVSKQTKSEYVFRNINDDLGKSCENIMKSTPAVKMAYGYARRAAVGGMYLQGIATKDIYDHVSAIFKSLQFQTGQTVEFQRQAFLDAIAYMQTYNPFITSFFVKIMHPMVEEYESSPNLMPDPEFFKAVLDAAYSAEEESRNK